MKVKVTYGDGSQEEIDKSDCISIAMVVNSIFGRELGPFEGVEEIIPMDAEPTFASVDPEVPPLPDVIPPPLTEAEILALAETPTNPVTPVETPVVPEVPTPAVTKGKKAKVTPVAGPAPVTDTPAPPAAPWE